MTYSPLPDFFFFQGASYFGIHYGTASSFLLIHHYNYQNSLPMSTKYDLFNRKPIIWVDPLEWIKPSWVNVAWGVVAVPPVSSPAQHYTKRLKGTTHSKHLPYVLLKTGRLGLKGEDEEKDVSYRLQTTGRLYKLWKQGKVHTSLEKPYNIITEARDHSWSLPKTTVSKAQVFFFSVILY